MIGGAGQEADDSKGNLHFTDAALEMPLKCNEVQVAGHCEATTPLQLKLHARLLLLIRFLPLSPLEMCMYIDSYTNIHVPVYTYIYIYIYTYMLTWVSLDLGDNTFLNKGSNV